MTLTVANRERQRSWVACGHDIKRMTEIYVGMVICLVVLIALLLLHERLEVGAARLRLRAILKGS